MMNKVAYKSYAVLNPVYTMQPVVQPAVQPVVQPGKCLYTRYSRLYNRLHRVYAAL